MFGSYIDASLLITLNQLVWYGVALAKTDNTYADVGWGTGFILVAYNAMSHHPSTLSRALFILALIWGLRLSGFILLRHSKASKEDWRYASMRQKWVGPQWLNSLLWVFATQGFFMWVISLVFQLSSPKDSMFSRLFLVVGFALSLAGIVYEAIADWQMFEFKSKSMSAGRTFSGGLWAYSRHPNYFGEMVAWWGMFIATLPLSPFHPFGAAAIVSPITITALLLTVSGVPLLERKLDKKEGFKEYQRTTNSVIPNFIWPEGRAKAL